MNKLILSFAFLFLQLATNAQNVGIGTNSPDSSALLELNSSNKGFLPPRITTSQRNSITHPAEGLQVFNTTTHCLEMFVYGRWQNVFCGVADTTIIVDSTLLTDIDGHTYPTVKICEQTWMAKNLDVARYRNGDIIPQVTDANEWANLNTGAWCWYNNDSATYGSVYGRLYNWYAVNDPRGLAPEGWHVPSDAEWNILVKCLDVNADTILTYGTQSTIAGGMMKEVGLLNWSSPNNDATNSSGFLALPGGYRSRIGGVFDQLHIATYWGISNLTSPTTTGYRGTQHYDGFLNRGDNSGLTTGQSIRCIKDAPPPTTLNNGLVAYYPFNGNANDESGNGNNGVVNGATLTTDRFGGSNKAYSFMNISDKIVAPTINCDGILKYSISGWFKKDLNASFGTIFAQSNGCNGSDGLRLFIGNDNILYWQSEQRPSGVCSGAGKRDVSHNFNDNQWHSFAVTYDGVIGTLASNQFNIFIDGILVESAENVVAGLNVSTPITNTTFSTTLGNVNNSVDAMRGILDDIRIYNRALTQEEISYLAGH